MTCPQACCVEGLEYSLGTFLLVRSGHLKTTFSFPIWIHLLSLNTLNILEPFDQDSVYKHGVSLKVETGSGLSLSVSHCTWEITAGKVTKLAQGER